MTFLQKSVCAFLPVLLATLLSSHSNAQLSIGAGSGVNFVDLHIKSSDKYFKLRAAPHFALLFNYAFSPTVSLQVEPGFSQRGAKIIWAGTAVINGQTNKWALKSRIIQNYIETPVLFQYKRNLGRYQALFSFGPELRFLAEPMKTKIRDQHFIDDEVAKDSAYTYTFSGKERATKFDMGLTAGAGFIYPVGKLKIIAEGRYHFGLMNIYRRMENNGTAAYTRGISIRAGVMIPIGKK